ncbi:uncharacterized protein LOC129575234 [Sitodiplosis mosellana]|uniref:uncharacterized protein LOC129575234 n=1 Tax=Sitodiplosis mosellana TaxID=263140 RepID=UPI0024439657|nr:uncharacterized protein LOC129575234 [Sitodiplosis mosellana]
MTYQSRSSRIKSLARNEHDSIYWSAIDTFSNVTDVTRSSSRQSISALSRNYIDPWDLENYAYIQSMEPDGSNPTPNSAHDDHSNPYYFTNTKSDDCPCYAGLDEQLFYNAKYEMIPDTNFTDMEEMSSNSCSGSSILQYRTVPQINFPPPPMQSSSAYECYANVIVPKRRSPFDTLAPESINGYHNNPNEPIYDTRQYQIEYPQPEYYYDQYANYVHGRRQSVSLPCYECIEMQQMPVYYAPSQIRDDNYDIYSQRRHLERFGLSKKGLLQIDYSLSWMNLQRIISSK